MSSKKPSLVFIVSRFPFPLEKGDKLRAYYQIRELSKNFDIHLISITDKKVSSKELKELETFCFSINLLRISNWSKFWNLASCLFTHLPFQVGYFYSFKNQGAINQLLKEIEPNYIYSQLIRTTEYVKDYHACPKTIDYMDALSKGIERRIDTEVFYKKFLFRSEAKRLRRYERSVFDYFEHHTIISEQDRNYIYHPDNKKILCIPNGISEAFFESFKLKKTHDLVFVGNLSYPPNVEAVKFIIKEILPKRPYLTFLIAGASPHPSIVRLSKQNPQVDLKGWVEDIRAVYVQGKIFIAPMMIGTGLQNKLLEAMALGTPCITSNLANNALNARENESILVAHSTEQYLTHIDALLSNDELYEKLSKSAKTFVKENFSWEKSCSDLNRLIQS